MMFRDRLARRRRTTCTRTSTSMYARSAGDPVPPPPLFTYRAASAPVGGDAGRRRSTSGSTAGFDGRRGRGTRRAARGSARIFGAARGHRRRATPLAPQNVVVHVRALRRRRPGARHRRRRGRSSTGTGDAWVFTGGQVDQGHVAARRRRRTPAKLLDADGHRDPARRPARPGSSSPTRRYPVTSPPVAAATADAPTPVNRRRSPSEARR